MKRFNYTAPAEADLDAIAAYYSANSLAAGVRLLREIMARCRQLANQPRQGTPRDPLGAGVRFVVVRQYLVFFRETATGVDVLRVLHGARDITPEMFDE